MTAEEFTRAIFKKCGDCPDWPTIEEAILLAMAQAKMEGLGEGMRAELARVCDRIQSSPKWYSRSERGKLIDDLTRA